MQKAGFFCQESLIWQTVSSVRSKLWLARQTHWGHLCFEELLEIKQLFTICSLFFSSHHFLYPHLFSKHPTLLNPPPVCPSCPLFSFHSLDRVVDDLNPVLTFTRREVESLLHFVEEEPDPSQVTLQPQDNMEGVLRKALHFYPHLITKVSNPRRLCAP